jgi:hypothetical protein
VIQRPPHWSDAWTSADDLTALVLLRVDVTLQFCWATMGFTVPMALRCNMSRLRLNGV